MFSRLLRLLRDAYKTYPVTAALISVAVGLRFAVEVYRLGNGDETGEALRHLGAVSNLMMVKEPELTGPFALWDGQLWRIPVSGFHHGGLLHLAMNCLAIGFMGRLLEPRMQRSWYFAFFVAATIVSFLPEYLCASVHGLPKLLSGGCPIGLSGAAYAMFGMLMVLRKRDAAVADMFTDAVVRFGLIWLLACIVLTTFDVLRIANLAHLTGLTYGWMAGECLFAAASARRPLRWMFYAGHLLLLPALYFIAHPAWNGSYHWYLVHLEQNPRRRIHHLSRAVELDPGLRRPWVYLAAIYGDRGDLQLAWRTILEGLYFNRSDEAIVQLSGEIWKRFRTVTEQEKALETLNEVLQETALAWQNRLGAFPGRSTGRALQVAETDDEADREDVNLPTTIDGSEELPMRELTAPPVDPDQPDSAAEGVKT